MAFSTSATNPLKFNKSPQAQTQPLLLTMAPKTTTRTLQKGSTTKKGTKAKLGGQRNGSIEQVEKRILCGMADQLIFDIMEVEQEQVLGFAGYKFPTAPRFHQTKKSLLAKGYIEYTSGAKTYRLTKEGKDAAAEAGGGTNNKQVEKPKTNEAFYEHLRGLFKEPKTFQLLQLMADGLVHERSTVCNDLGYKYQTAPGFAKAVAELKKLGFLEQAGKGLFRSTDKAFPCGRPYEDMDSILHRTSS